MKNVDDIITNIEARARVVGISIAALCREAGVDNSTFTRWKSNKTKPNFESYIKISKALERKEKAVTNGAVQPNDFFDLPTTNKESSHD